jgi:hypothetical protein
MSLTSASQTPRRVPVSGFAIEKVEKHCFITLQVGKEIGNMKNILFGQNKDH